MGLGERELGEGSEKRRSGGVSKDKLRQLHDSAQGSSSSSNSI